MYSIMTNIICRESHYLFFISTTSGNLTLDWCPNKNVSSYRLKFYLNDSLGSDHCHVFSAYC